MKRFIVIGLGSFGATVARRLSENGCRVTAIDACRERAELVEDTVYEAIIGDATERETLEEMNLHEADAVVISLGADITTSLLATLHARELHAQRMIVKGVSPEHEKILKYLGVERVVFPKIEVGHSVADNLTWPNMIDYLPIGQEYGVDELNLPVELAGKTLRESQLRERYGVNVLGVKDKSTGKFDLLPAADFLLRSNQIAVVIGQEKDLKRLREME